VKLVNLGPYPKYLDSYREETGRKVTVLELFFKGPLCLLADAGFSS
jgi:hypothetical protein